MYQKIDFKNKQIHYRDEGKGKCIVLLHGFPESLQIWDNFVTELQKDYRVICVDLPGHGESDCIDEVHTMELLAEAVNNVLIKLGIEKCLMTGHSMGGYVTLEFAKQQPEKLSGIVLFHSQAGADTETARKNRDRTIEIVNNDKIGFISFFIPDLFAEENKMKYEKEIDSLKKVASQTSAESIIAALKGMKERSSKIEMLGEWNFPVLFITGKKDKRITTEMVLAQIGLPKHGEALILEKAGHMGFIEAKTETLETIKSFAHKSFLLDEIKS